MDILPRMTSDSSQTGKSTIIRSTVLRETCASRHHVDEIGEPLLKPLQNKITRQWFLTLMDVLNPHKFHTCIRQTLHSWKNKMCREF